MPFEKGNQHWEKRKDLQQASKVRVKVTEAVIIAPSVAIPPDQHKDTIKRHTVGLMSAIETMYGAVLTPKCRTCFDAYGWLTKCKCEKETR